jgi:branched-chain amino acid aminotransferase, group I
MNENERLIWLGGKIVPITEAKINVLSPTSQFGANVFEGIRCYWNEKEKQLYAFRLDDHYKRLHDSIKIFKMKSSYTTEDFKHGLIDVVKANNYKEDIAVRQTVFVDGLGGTWSSCEPINMFISPIPKGRTLIEGKTGLKCCISSWERISDRNLSPRAKVGANYINSRMAHLEAVENGYDTAILMNNHGKIAEGPGSCLFIIRNGVLITPPCTASVLESITRDTIIQIAKDILNIPIIERDIDRTELYICEEAFLCGSAMEITQVINIDGYFIGDGNCGKMTKSLFKEYYHIITGNYTEYTNWLTPIYY